MFTATYLGREINHQLHHAKEIKRRIEIARTGFLKIQNILCNPSLFLEVRLRTVKCYVWSLLLYGCETWTVKQEKLQKFGV